MLRDLRSNQRLSIRRSTPHPIQRTKSPDSTSKIPNANLPQRHPRSTAAILVCPFPPSPPSLPSFLLSFRSLTSITKLKKQNDIPLTLLQRRQRLPGGIDPVPMRSVDARVVRTPARLPPGRVYRSAPPVRRDRRLRHPDQPGVPLGAGALSGPDAVRLRGLPA